MEFDPKYARRLRAVTDPVPVDRWTLLPHCHNINAHLPLGHSV